MILVPRQLLRSGMTGNVPYYGGRFTPAQAYAASHPSAPPRRPTVGAHAPLPPAPPAPAPPKQDSAEALRQLHEAGVLTDEEYADLLDRAAR